ncbi:aminopeptidase o [Plakobranchus ocellatus]|uniref:Aminopeptidase o n=1 Tax=Plakobranchus ocellatus TaxID=259542 RepID=A0AAV4DUM2_9GAST|nr:aminopeptidase o [Plakobranchus ocellatus]
MPNSSSTSVAANFHNSKDTAVYSSHQDFVLDCHALDIDSCYFYDLQKDSDIDVTTYSNIYTYKTNLQIPSNEMKKYYDIAEKLSKNAKGNQLDFKVEESCLRIFIPHKDFYQQRVFAVKIGYKTKKEGSSLTWAEDQNLRPCVFTSGHLLNNRSLMPCQDMPQAMSSWHCLITVPPFGEQLTVLMAGEGEPAVDVREDGSQVFKYQSSYPMPASTFALAIGNWPLYCSFPHQIDNCFKQSTSCLGPRFQIFAPLNLHGQKLGRLKEYLQDCFHGLQSILGAYPLQRLDILVVPEGFDSLGMMCPHLMFLSQSVLLCEDTQAAFNMFYRVAHELCHTWLGVLTGPSDWTEEWLTEGICCYLEDVVHAKTLKWNEHETRERLEIRKLLKYRVLKAEINTTREDLQTLRPNGDTSCASLSSMNAEPCIVKNGLNPEKTLLQVHYLKGFFLLKHLEELSGRDEFLGTLRRFIDANLGQLFSSKDLLEHCFRELPKLRQSNLTVDIVCQEWLDTPGMPQPLTAFEVNEENSLYKDVKCEVRNRVTEAVNCVIELLLL